MITKNEINRLAQEQKVRTTTIDKDWVLGHFIDAIYTIRALIQRSYTAPRDYFDIWYLSKNIENIDWKEVIKGFRKKVEYKKLQFGGIEQLTNENNDRILKSTWKNSLEHQIKNGKLPAYEMVINDLKILFEKTFKEE